jgi:hypothetical protein
LELQSTNALDSDVNRVDDVGIQAGVAGKGLPVCGYWVGASAPDGRAGVAGTNVTQARRSTPDHVSRVLCSGQQLVELPSVLEGGAVCM